MEVAACNLEPVGRRSKSPTYYPFLVTCAECQNTKEFKKRTHFPIPKEAR